MSGSRRLLIGQGTAKTGENSDQNLKQNNSNTNNNNSNRVTFAPQPIIIRGSGQQNDEDCKDGTFVQSHTERRGRQKEFFICIKKPDIQPNLNVEHRDIYSEQLIRLDQGMDILDRNGLNYNLEIDINHETIFMAHMAKLLAKSGYFFDSVVNFRPNYDFENSRIEVKNPEITPDVFSSLLDLIYFRTVKTCRDGLQAIGRAAQILDMAEVVKACQELGNPSSVQKKEPDQHQQNQSTQQQQQQFSPHPQQFHNFNQGQSLQQQPFPQPQQMDINASAQPFVAAGFPPPSGPHPQPLPHFGQFPDHHVQPCCGSSSGCGGQIPLRLPGPPPLPPSPYSPPQPPHTQSSVPTIPPHHHHPIPRQIKCRQKSCCEREKCNHCDASKATCALCEESCSKTIQTSVPKPAEQCCRSNEPVEDAYNSSHDSPGEGYCRLPPFTEDGTPPCKSPLQLLFEAMDKGASEQFHAAYNKLMDNFVNISTTKDFLNLNHHQLSFILASDSLVVPDEMFVFQSALRWIQFDLIARIKYAVKVCKAIRFPLLTWEQLLEVQREPLLANERAFHELLQPSMSFFQSGKEKAVSLGYKRPRRRRFTAA